MPTLSVGTALSPPKKWKFEIWGGAGDGGAGLFAPPRAGVFTLGYVARGVRVRVFTNGPSAEAAFLYHAQRHRYRSLLDSNVEILETVQQYNHTKFLVVDEKGRLAKQFQTSTSSRTCPALA